MYLPGECYIHVFMALLGVILFNIMTGRTVNEHSAPSGVTFDQNGQNAIYADFEFLAVSLPS